MKKVIILFVAPLIIARLQNSPYFCVFKYAGAVKQKAWNEADGRVRLARFARKPLMPHFTDFFTDFEKKTDCFAVYPHYHSFSQGLAVADLVVSMVNAMNFLSL